MNFIFPHEEGFSLYTLVACLKRLRELEADDEDGKITSVRQQEYLAFARRWKFETSCDTVIRYLEWKLAECMAEPTLRAENEKRAILKLATVFRPEYDLLPYYMLGSCLGLQYNEDLDYDPKDVAQAIAQPGAWGKVRDELRYWYIRDLERLRALYAAIKGWRGDTDRECRSALDKACEEVENRDLWGKDIRGEGDHFELVSGAKRDARDFV